MTRTMWEMTLGNESVLFASEMDAASAMARQVAAAYIALTGDHDVEIEPTTNQE